MEDFSLFLWIALAAFVVTSLVQLIFPVEVYERARESSRLNVPIKGLFAQTVESLYQIKTNGFDAPGRYWWHLTWFNTAVSISVSAIVMFWVFVAIAIVAIIVIIIVIGMLSN